MIQNSKFTLITLSKETKNSQSVIKLQTNIFACAVIFTNYSKSGIKTIRRKVKIATLFYWGGGQWGKPPPLPIKKKNYLLLIRKGIKKEKSENKTVQFGHKFINIHIHMYIYIFFWGGATS